MITAIVDNQDSFVQLLRDWAGWLFFLAIFFSLCISDIGGKK